MNEGSARYAHEHDTWFIKLAGDVCHPLAPSLNALLDQAFAKPESRFVIDVTKATIIDSTCLGVLARIINHRPGSDQDAGECLDNDDDDNTSRPIIITGGEDIHELLLAVCFDEHFDLVESADGAQGTLQFAPPVEINPEDTLKFLLDAHRRLCAIDSKTHSMFKDVVETMAIELDKQRNKKLRY